MAVSEKDLVYAIITNKNTSYDASKSEFSVSGVKCQHLFDLEKSANQFVVECNGNSYKTSIMDVSQDWFTSFIESSRTEKQSRPKTDVRQSFDDIVADMTSAGLLS